MKTVAELREAQFRALNGNGNKDIWGDILFNVKVYGAKGDGVKDDTEHIQDAIDEASEAGGGTVFFPNGTYNCWNIVMKSNVLLVGDKGTTLKRINNAAQEHWITANSATNFGIAAMTLDGNKALTPSFPYTDSINFVNCGQFELNKLTVKNSVNRGIYIEKNTDVTISKHSRIESCYVLSSSSGNIVLRDCSELVVSRNSVSASTDNGIVVEYTASRYTSGNTLRIEHNKVFDNGANGIWCYSNYTSSAERQTPIAILNIDSNEVYNNGDYGIITQINESYLTNNDVHDNADTGIMVNTSKVTISGGAIERNTNNGIDLGDCYDIIVQGVIIEENGTTGIEVNSSEEVLIDSCIIRFNNSTNVAVPFGANNAIYIYQGTDGTATPFPGDSKNVQVKNCIIRRKTGYFQDIGIRVGVTGTRVTLIGNDVYDSGNLNDFLMEDPDCFLSANISKDTDYNSAQANITAASDIYIPAEGDTFFIDGSGTIDNIFIKGGASARKGRKIAFILNGAFITLAAGDGSSGNILNNGDLDVTGYLKIVEYICLGGSFPSWLQFSASSGR